MHSSYLSIHYHTYKPFLIVITIYIVLVHYNNSVDIKIQHEINGMKRGRYTVYGRCEFLFVNKHEKSVSVQYKLSIKYSKNTYAVKIYLHRK